MVKVVTLLLQRRFSLDEQVLFHSRPEKRSEIQAKDAQQHLADVETLDGFFNDGFEIKTSHVIETENVGTIQVMVLWKKDNV